MSLGLTLDPATGCLVSSTGPCLATSECPAVTNTDSCFALCCQILIANTTLTNSDTVLAGDYVTASTDITTFHINKRSCPDPLTITLDVSGKWIFLIDGTNSELISAANLTCPPIDDDGDAGSVWVATGPNSTSFTVTGVYCCQVIAPPDTTMTFTITNIIGTCGSGTSMTTTQVIWTSGVVVYAADQGAWIPDVQVNPMGGIFPIAIAALGGGYYESLEGSFQVSVDADGCRTAVFTIAGGDPIAINLVWGRNGGGASGALGFRTAINVDALPQYVFYA